MNVLLESLDIASRQLREIDDLINTVNPAYLSTEIKKLRQKQKNENDKLVDKWEREGV